MDSEKRATGAYDGAQLDTSPAELNPVVTKQRQEFLRMRNALYARRKYARRKIEAEVLRDQCLYLEEQNHHLRLEERRLRNLLKQAARFVHPDSQADSSSTYGLKLNNTSTDSIPSITNGLIKSLWVQNLARQLAQVPSHGLYHPLHALTFLQFAEQQLGEVPTGQFLSASVRGLMSPSTTAPSAVLNDLDLLQSPRLGQMRRSLASQQST